MDRNLSDDKVKLSVYKLRDLVKKSDCGVTTDLPFSIPNE